MSTKVQTSTAPRPLPDPAPIAVVEGGDWFVDECGSLYVVAQVGTCVWNLIGLGSGSNCNRYFSPTSRLHLTSQIASCVGTTFTKVENIDITYVAEPHPFVGELLNTMM